MKAILIVLMMMISVNCFAGWNKHQTNEKRILFEVDNRYADVSSGVAGVHTLWTMPAKTTLLSVSAYVDTAITGGTMAIGDGSTADGYLIEGFEAGAGFYPVKSATAASTYAGDYIIATEGSTAVELVGGKYYAASDTLDLSIGSAITAGKVYFVVKFMVH